MHFCLDTENTYLSLYFTRLSYPKKLLFRIESWNFSLSLIVVRWSMPLLMRLKKCYLEVLLEAINSDGAVPGGCVLIPVAASTTSGTPVHLLMSQVFRWPDVYQESELKRLSFCELYSKVSDAKNQEKHATFEEAASRLRPLQKLYECCNPFHWSRLQKQRE